MQHHPASRSIHWLLLVAGVLSQCCLNLGSSVSSCPSRGLIRPCECNEISKGLEVLCEGIYIDQLQDVFNKVQQTKQTIIYLKMKNNHLERFPPMLTTVRIRHLSAHQCNIHTIDQFAFGMLKDELESIDLSENKLSEIPEALKNLTALVSLNLNFNQITTIDERALDGLVSLLRLSLYGNKIVTIHERAFFGVGVNLTRINFGGNKLVHVPSVSLSHLNSLQRLQFHENRLETLQTDDFALLRAIDNLDVLNFASNYLTKLDNYVFSDLKAINSLDFESNRIRIIEGFAFSGIESSLEWLKLGENELEDIPLHALANLTKLRELDLRGNRIRHVNKHSLSSFGANIKFLYLQKNRIETIEESSFDGLVSLEWIYLNSNRLKQMPESSFGRSLNTLWIIDLQDNPLICGCHLAWYNRWREQKPKTNLDRGIECEMVDDEPSNHQRRSSGNHSFDPRACNTVPYPHLPSELIILCFTLIGWLCLPLCVQL